MSYHERIRRTPDKSAWPALRAHAVFEAAQERGHSGNTVTATTSDGKHAYEWERVERSGPNEIRVYPVGAPPGSDAYVTIVNPPLLVKDHSGPIEVGGERFREDPLAALADVLHANRPQIQRESPAWR